MYDSNPLELMKYVLGELDKKDLAFVELKRHGVQDSSRKAKDGKDEKGRDLPEVQIPKFFESLRPYYKGTLMGNDGFNPQSADEAIQSEQVDIVSFSSLAINNPDLVDRIEHNWNIDTNFDRETWFQGGGKGYTDYPYYEKEEKSED